MQFIARQVDCSVTYTPAQMSISVETCNELHYYEPKCVNPTRLNYTISENLNIMNEHLSDLKHIFGPEGFIAQGLSEYEYRPQQLEMANAVADAFPSK